MNAVFALSVDFGGLVRIYLAGFPGYFGLVWVGVRRIFWFVLCGFMVLPLVLVAVDDRLVGGMFSVRLCVGDLVGVVIWCSCSLLVGVVMVLGFDLDYVAGS